MRQGTHLHTQTASIKAQWFRLSTPGSVREVSSRLRSSRGGRQNDLTLHQRYLILHKLWLTFIELQWEDLKRGITVNEGWKREAEIRKMHKKEWDKERLKAKNINQNLWKPGESLITMSNSSLKCRILINKY